MDRDQLDAVIEEAPDDPGVYLFTEGERVLYVGKAVSIAERLQSYRDPRSPRIASMVAAATSLETRRAADGRRALLLEANLIKRYQPRYNTRLKDGKSYPVIELTDHRFPQIRASRDPDARSMVFGPFTSMGTVRMAIKAFRDMYGIRNCSDHTFETRDRPCVAYQMGLCSAPCAGLISEEEYGDRIDAVVSFFRDDPSMVLEMVEQRMEEAASEQLFERAATLRDYRDALRALIEGRERRETGMTHAIAVGPDRGWIGQVVVEDAQITVKTRHRLAGEPESDADAVSSFIQQFYARNDLPERIVTGTELEDEMARQWLTGEGTEVTVPASGRDRVLVDAARSAAAVGDDRPSFAPVVDDEVRRIEAFDISHMGGEDVVGSNVVVRDGEPFSADYRRTYLSERNDDRANMAELVKWRAERALEGRDERPSPDILVIDGGHDQLRAAWATLDRLGWSVPVLAVAKPDDRILVPGEGVVSLDERAHQEVTIARDEAHRFAKATHAGSRDAVVSVLEEIDGIGPSRRKALLRRFSLDEIREAGVEELTQVDGIGRSVAVRITESLGSRQH